MLNTLWNDENGQDIAEYAVMIAVILRGHSAFDRHECQ